MSRISPFKISDMKTRFLCLALTLALTEGMTTPVRAQLPIATIIRAGIKAAIRIADLKVQVLQQKTLALENTQQILENTLRTEKLQEIAEWTGRGQDLWRAYYQGLWQVKAVIRNCQAVRRAEQLESEIARGYDQAWRRFQSDPRFSAAERRRMQSVFAAILQQAAGNAALLKDAVTPFRLQMDDAARRHMIAQATHALQRRYDALRRFTAENALVSLRRAASAKEAAVARRLYDIR